VQLATPAAAAAVAVAIAAPAVAASHLDGQAVPSALLRQLGVLQPQQLLQQQLHPVLLARLGCTAQPQRRPLLLLLLLLCSWVPAPQAAAAGGW
jgi:hypothetical protein